MPKNIKNEISKKELKNLLVNNLTKKYNYDSLKSKRIKLN